MLREHSATIEMMMRLMDLAVTAGAWALCFHIRFTSGWVAMPKGPPTMDQIVDIVIVNLLLVLLIFQWMGLYLPRRTQPIRSEIWDLVRAAAAVWILEVAIAHFLHSSPVSRKLQGLVLIVWPILLIGYRSLIRLALHRARRHGLNLRAVAMIGVGRAAQKLVHDFSRQRWTGYRVHYFLDDDREGDTLMGVPVYGPISECRRIVREKPVDAVFIALPAHRIGELETVMGELSDLLIDVNVVPDLIGHLLLNHRTIQIGSMPVINLTHTPQAGVSGLWKRSFDVVVCLALLIVLSPLMALIALAVKLTSRGPVFYRQIRAGIGGQEFTILKFRSMVNGADGPGPVQWGVDAEDPRVTPLGRLLRKTSLDELPQLLNVLIGDMSLVGPRPERVEFIERFRQQFPRYMLRHHVKAGITGWAQVNGFRGRTSIRKRLQYDLDYINNWSLLFDIRILVLTVIRGLFNAGG